MYKICVFGVIACVLFEPVISFYRESRMLRQREMTIAKEGRKGMAYVTRYAKLQPEQGRRQVPYVTLPDGDNPEAEVPMEEAVSAMEPGKRVPVVCCKLKKEFVVRPEQDCKFIAEQNYNRASGFRKSSMILLGVAAMCLATMAFSLSF